MTHYTGTLTAVPTANRQAVIEHSARAWPIFREHGALRMVETWGEDVRPGEQTDFIRAVQAGDDETVMFSWIEWPDKATADAAWQTMQGDPEIEARMGEMPFDGKRMVFGDFEPAFGEGTDKGAGWIQGFVTPVPEGNRDAFVTMAGEAWRDMFKPQGCLGSFENWASDVPHGTVTDFYKAVDAKDGEVIVFSWTAWPDRATCDAAEKAMEASMADSPPPEDMPFDMSRMIWSGFVPVFDSNKA